MYDFLWCGAADVATGFSAKQVVPLAAIEKSSVEGSRSLSAILSSVIRAFF